MSLDSGTEVLLRQMESERRQVNFLMAAAGACIAYALSQVEGKPFSSDMIALGLALLAWGISFYTGCAAMSYSIDHGKQIAEELKKDSAGSQKISTMLARVYKSATSWSDEHSTQICHKGQIMSLFVGVIFYVAWQVWRMYLRTGA